MKKFLSVICLCFLTVFCFTGCDLDTDDDYDQPLTQLLTPVIILDEDDNMLYWTAIDHVVEYEVNINSITYVVDADITSYPIMSGTVKVRAIGDGEKYINSGWSNTLTKTLPPTPIQLNTPVVTIDKTGVASWLAISNASGYIYKINNGTEQFTTETIIQLTDGDSIVVKTAGDGSKFTSSSYSEAKTYTAPTIPTLLPRPIVSVDESGIATWQIVYNASGYEYKINNAEEQSTNLTSVQLDDKDTLVVKAVGDGIEFSDSEYSVSVTYNAPIIPEPLSEVQNIQVNSPTKTISFDAIDNAVSYEITITNSQNTIVHQSTISETTITITENFIVDTYTCKIVAIPSSEDEEFLNSNPAKQSFSVTKADSPTIIFENNVFTVIYIGEVVAKFNGFEISLTNNTYTITESGTLAVTKFGDGGFILNSDEVTMQATYVAPPPTYETSVEALTTEITSYIQTFFPYDRISGVEIEHINATNGDVYLTYLAGETEKFAKVNVVELTTSTFEDITNNADTFTYTGFKTRNGLLSNEDAVRLIEIAKRFENPEVVKGYMLEDIAWVYATDFTADYTTYITVVFNDGTLLEYNVTITEATSKDTAIDFYFYGAYVVIEVTSTTTFESLEYKFN